MAYPVIISYNSASHKEHAFATDLVNYLGAKNIETVASDPNRSEPTMKQWLLNAQWLVLVLTPEAIRSPRVKSLVDTAFDRVRQGQMHGVLALAFSSNPVEPEDMPNPLWSTIRTYYVGESDEDLQRAFEKVARTLGYTKVLVQAASSSANNWASTPGSQVSTSSRLLPVYPQSAQKRLPRIATSAMIAIALLIIFSGTLLGFNFLRRPSSTPSSRTTPVSSRSHQTAPPKTTPTVIPANATATETAKLQNLYTRDTSKPPDFVMNAQDPNQQWDQSPQNSTCTFTKDGSYHVTNANAGQYTPCMARKTSFRNFVYQVQMIIKSGDAGGLIFRSDDPSTTFYRFSLTKQGEYTLFVCQPSTCTLTSTGEGKSLVNGNLSGQPNTLAGQSIMLAVIVQDNHFYLYINKKFVNKADDLDSTTGEGEIGVYAASVSTPFTEVTFSKVQVWSLS